MKKQIFSISFLIACSIGINQLMGQVECPTYDDNVYGDESTIPYGYPDIKNSFNQDGFCVALPDRGDVDINNDEFGNNPYAEQLYLNREGGLYPGPTNTRSDVLVEDLTYLTTGQVISAVLAEDEELVFVQLGASVPTSIFYRFSNRYDQDVAGIKFITAGQPDHNLSEYTEGTACTSPPTGCTGDYDYNGIKSTALDQAMFAVASSIYDGTLLTSQVACVNEICKEVDVIWMMNSLKEIEETGLSDIDPDWKTANSKYEFVSSTYNQTAFEEAIDVNTTYFKEFLQAVNVCFPNVQMIYISPQTYAGYSDQAHDVPGDVACSTEVHPLINAPYDYWNSWIVQEVVKQYCSGILWEDAGSDGDPDEDLDPTYPYITWGPYFWTRGESTPEFNLGTGAYVDNSYDTYDPNHLWAPEHFDTDDGFHLSNGVDGGEIYSADWMRSYFELENEKIDGVSSWFNAHDDDCVGDNCSFTLKVDCEGDWSKEVGLSSFNDQIINAYPNPFNNQITLNLGNSYNLENNYRIEIFNILGELVKSSDNIQSKNFTFALEVPTGIYSYVLLEENIIISTGMITKQ